MRSGDVSGIATIDYATRNGTASENRNYIVATGTLRFSAMETTKSFNVLVVDSAYADGDKTVNLTLSNASGGQLGTLNAAVLTIKDNDFVAPSGNPVDDPYFFVRQHYRTTMCDSKLRQQDSRN